MKEEKNAVMRLRARKAAEELQSIMGRLQRLLPEVNELLLDFSAIESSDPALDLSIDILGLSTRIRNCCEMYGVATVRDLVRKDERTVSHWKNMGKKSVAELKDALAVRGLTLGMRLEYS